jgi:hypothetical protein
MKTQELKEGLKETSKNYIVDLDTYTQRERFYQGTPFGQVLLIEKVVYPDLLKEGYNDHFDTELDVIISKFHDGVEMRGVKLFRKGHKVQ